MAQRQRDAISDITPSIKRAEKLESKGTDMMNSLAVGVNKLYAGIAKIPRYLYEVPEGILNILADAVENNAGKEAGDILRPTESGNYDALLAETNRALPSGMSPLTAIDKMGTYFQDSASDYEKKAVKYDKDIVNSLGDGNFSDAGAQIVNNIVGSVPDMLAMYMTSGAGSGLKLGSLGKTTLSALPFASSKANQIRDNKDIPEGIKPFYSLANGFTEVIFDQSFGTQAILNKITNTLKDGGEKEAFQMAKDVAKGYFKNAFAKVKEPLTDFGNNAIEEMSTQLSQNILDKLVVDPNKDLMDGVLDAGVVGGAMGLTLGSVNTVLKSEQKESITNKNLEIENLSNDLDNPNIPPSTKEIIEKTISEKKKEIHSEIEGAKKEFSKLSEEQKEQALEVSAKINDLETSLEQEGISETAKKTLSEQIQVLDKELDEIKPSNEATVKQEVITPKEEVVAVEEVKEPVVEKQIVEETKPIENEPVQVDNKVKDVQEKAVEKEPVKIKYFTDSKVINDGYKAIKNKVGEKKATKYFEQVDKLFDPNKTTVLEYRPNGVVIQEGEKATFVPLVDMDFKNWRKSTRTTDISEQFPQLKEQANKDFALSEVKKGAINWDGDRFTPRPELGLEWKDIRKGQQDLLDGKDTPASKRLVEAINKAKENGGYDYVQGSGKMTSKTFVPLNEKVELSKDELADITKNEDNLATQYDEWFDSLDESEKQEELNSIEYGNESKGSETTVNKEPKGKEDVSDTEDSKAERKDIKPTVSEKLGEIEVKRQAIKDRIAEKFKSQRANLSSGFDPSLLKDFIELGSTYIEEGVIKASDFIKRFREDYKSMGFEDELTDEQITEEIFDKVSKEETKETKAQSDFDKLATKSLPKRETRETKSNVEDVTGDVLTTDIKEFEGVDFKQSLIHGDNVVQQAKLEFGDSYVSDLLDYVGGAKMPFENKAVLLVSLENDLRKQLLADPKNVRLRKQVNTVTKASIEHLRSGATAAAVGQFRWAARANYETELAAASIFTPKEREQRAKVEGAVHSTSEDVQTEYEEREARLNDIIDEGVEKRINELYESLPSNRRKRADKAIAALDRIQKRLRGKTYDATIGVPIAIIDAGISTIKAAIKAGVNVLDAIELGINKIKSEYGSKWDKEAEFRKDMLAGFKTEGVDVKEGINNSLKKELIDAGYGKEINVKTKEGREKRNILDWKKLTGIEGSFDNMRDNLDKSLKGKGYSESEINEFQKQLQDEYNDIHADIIEKSINELNRRNATKDVETKTLARRLAELYNLGLYDKDVDTYSNILNNALGVSPKSQEAFNEIRDFNKSLARLLETKDVNGNNLSDVALASAETQIKNHIKRVIEKVQYAEGNGLFKASVILKNLFSAMQRMMLVKLSQLVENPFSGKLNDLQVKMQDLFKKGKWDTRELAQMRKDLGRAIYEDVTVRRGDEYGGVGNPFTSKNTIENFVNGFFDNKNAPNAVKTAYNALTALLSGRLYLDAADSYFKIKRTEKEFTHNLLRILTDKSNPNGAMTQEQALHYVSETLTGQSFEDSKTLARQIIEDINKNAGKEILRDNESNVIRLANDLVKDALVNRERMTAKQVEQSFKAAYKTAGKSIGHESNNIITDAVGKINESIQTKLNEALKKKDWTSAAWLNLTSILSKNIVNPFVGGGTNWTVIGLQKMGVPTEWFRTDVGFSERPLDLSTKEGAKEADKVLSANATRQRMNGRIVSGTLTAAVMLLALKGSGSDDEYLKWLRKHPEARKIANKVMPTWLTLYLARDNKNSEFLKALFESMGSRKDFDAMKVEKASKDFYKAYADGDQKAMKRAWGTVGELTGRRFTVPYLSTFSNYGVTEDKLYKEFIGKPDKKQYKPSKSFVSGFYRDGLIDYLGLRPESSGGSTTPNEAKEKN